MLKKAIHGVLTVAVALILSLGIASEPLAVRGGQTPDRTVTLPPEGIPTDRYIVLLRDDVRDPRAVANSMAATHGLGLVHVYAAALKGFAATVPPGRLTALARDPRVQRVEPEEVQHIVQQTIPTGIDRIDAEANAHAKTKASNNIAEGKGVHVAIIDTGILASHPDLNVAGGANFSGGSADGWSDGNGHGTHVAGTVGAIDNGFGVVGVAPGTPVWAVKVCKNGGTCMTGDMVAGIDWVVKKKQDYKSDPSGGINFAAANMSISTRDSATACGPNSDAVHKAICRLVEEGVVFVLAAGNEGRRKAAYPEALTVAAIADFDGKEGGAGAPTCRNDEDDTLANFSNYEVDIAAPGTCILSTWNNGGYATISGTSMAAPHVTGAVALYLYANDLEPAMDRAGADAIKDAIMRAARPQGTTNHPCSYNNERGTNEPLLFVNDLTFFKGTNKCEVAGAGVTPDNDASGGVEITKIVPDSMKSGTTADVTISGTGFATGATVSFVNGNGPTPRASVKSVDDTTINATVTVGSGGPPRDRIWDVRVTNPDGSSGTLQRGFTVNP